MPSPIQQTWGSSPPTCVRCGCISNNAKTCKPRARKTKSTFFTTTLITSLVTQHITGFKTPGTSRMIPYRSALIARSKLANIPS